MTWYAISLIVIFYLFIFNWFIYFIMILYGLFYVVYQFVRNPERNIVQEMKKFQDSKLYKNTTTFCLKGMLWLFLCGMVVVGIAVCQYILNNV
jgi:fatty acid desaturase